MAVHLIILKKPLWIKRHEQDFAKSKFANDSLVHRGPVSVKSVRQQWVTLMSRVVNDAHPSLPYSKRVCVIYMHMYMEDTQENWKLHEWGGLSVSHSLV